MPQFLEEKLRKEYGNNPAAIYGTMNKIGAMHGNKETAKGREMEKKHEGKMKKTGAKMREMRIEMHHSNGKLTGMTVHHHMMPEKASKSGAFMEEMHHSFPFGADDHEAMMNHISDHLMGDGEAMDSAKKSESDAGAVDDGRKES